MSRAFCLAGLAVFGAGAQTREISFDERVAAQRAIDALYYSHQIEATRPFEGAVSRDVLEAEVRRYLGQSAALAAIWNSPIETDALRNEMARIARDTRFPDRLGEIYVALGNDGVLIQECLARRTLADRRSRELFAFDRRIHAASRAEAQSLRLRLENGVVPLSSDEPHRRVTELRRVRPGDVPPGGSVARARFLDERHLELRLDPESFAAWRGRLPARVGEVGPIVEEPDAFVLRAVLDEKPDHFVIASYVVAKRTWDDWWQEVAQGLEALPVTTVAAAGLLPRPASPSGAAWPDSAPPTCAPTDSWDNGSLGAVPDGRDGATAVWTGSEMIVWGGTREGRYLQTGGRYDPATDGWKPVSLLNAPAPRWGHTAVWTGNLMVVWGGTGGGAAFDTGGRYDPLADLWAATPSANAPQARQNHAAVWTGRDMIVWGGQFSDINGSHFLDTGGLYDPSANTWRPTTTTGAPEGRQYPTAVWTGSRMIVWGGRITSTGSLVNTGGVYDAAADAWAPTSTSLAPSPRELHTAVWTGQEMLVWGGHDYVAGSPRPLDTGGRYDPLTNDWQPIATAGAPQARRRHTAEWTGEEMIVWGGDASGAYLASGGRYDPAADTWVPVSQVGAPQGRTDHVAVWTSRALVVWGGSTSGAIALSSGGRYDPLLDRWTPTYAPNAPDARQSPSTVWTGSLWIVWGGLRSEEPLNTGGRYDPLTDNWSPTSLVNVTRLRVYHTAVWTGDRMIIWGGEPCPFVYDRGGSYDPVSDAWQPIDYLTEPAPRRRHTAVWTGDRMVVWGGLTCESTTSVTSTGALFDPATNQWSSTSLTKSPVPREEHSVVWTGSRMIVWGGGDADPVRPSVFDTGGTYDPGTNAWNALPKGGSPSPRRRHTAVWTGTSMIVWGGTGASDFNTGARYDPAADHWYSISSALAPSPRLAHTAVWAGSVMVVWGGETSAVGLDALATGGRYDPSSNTWSPVSLVRVPSPRHDHVAGWTGTFMLVWGGTGEYTLDSGGRYVVTNPDGDLDGVADVCDCAPSDPNLFAVPGEVGGLRFAADRTTLVWTSAAGSGGSATVHDVLRGALSGLPVNGEPDETCAASGITAATAQDPATPAEGDGFWYLVRGKNACGTGTYGQDSAGVERVSAACP